MHVVIVTQFPGDPGSPRGGVEAVSVNLVEHLATQAGVKVSVVTQDRAVSSVEVSPWKGAEIHRLPRGSASELVNAVTSGKRQVGEYVAALKPDVVHAHDTYGMMVTSLDVPRVFTIHGFIFGDTLVSGERLAKVRSIIWKHFETKGWSKQPHIISISPYVRERLAGVASGVIHDIDNPISDRFFGIRREVTAPVIFCSGVICARKNQIALVEAVARLAERGREVSLRLAGGVSEAAYGDSLRKIAADRGIAASVAMLGQISVDQVMAELASCSIFALVSLEENSPMGIEEAMAAGVPVVTSNRCGMPYMVRDGATGYLVDPFDADDIADRLGEILGDPELQQRMGTKAREIALDRFHPDNVSRRTLEVYRRAQSRRKPV